MFNVPNQTEFNKRIPKQKFYENLSVSPTLKRVFVEQIKIIYWRNKLATSTLNITAGEAVEEIEVFEVRLNQFSLDESALLQMDRQIPYHILFLLEYEGKYQAWIGYKEAVTGANAFKVSRYYHTDWLPEDELPLKIEGLTLDAVYENFVRQIAGDDLTTDSGETLKESIDRSREKAELEKQIAALQTKIRREKQFNRQVELNGELKKLKKMWEDISNGQN